MKKLVALLAVALPLMGQAQPPEGQDWWACQSVEYGGLKWENGKWKGTLFNHDKRFVLIAEDGGLKKSSVAKAMDAYPEELICSNQNVAGHIFCLSEWTGDSFGFDPQTGNGSIGGILGAVLEPSANGSRDTLGVTAFECAKG